jgi:hypothetical protein
VDAMHRPGSQLPLHLFLLELAVVRQHHRKVLGARSRHLLHGAIAAPQQPNKKQVGGAGRGADISLQWALTAAASAGARAGGRAWAAFHLRFSTTTVLHSCCTLLAPRRARRHSKLSS